MADEARALAYRGAEKDLGAVAVEEAPVPSSPMPVNPGFLPAEQPLCPRCTSGLYAIRQNGRGDTLFECLKCAADADSYQAIFRLNPPRWEAHPNATSAQVELWRAPVRFKDLEVKKTEPEKPVDAPMQAWPENAGGSKKRRRAKITTALGGERASKANTATVELPEAGA
jgi:hypothetical protein